jgi:small subunit ribosomal protein S2
VPTVSMRELLEAGVHFGHQTRRWNPKMRRFIFTERGGIYIIDLTQTSDLLDEAYAFARNLAARGGTMLFVGTKKQAQDAVADEAKRVGMPFVNHRWLGGLLTNWRTMSDRVERLHDLRRLKEEGQLDLLPAKERIQMLGELEKLEANLGGVADMRRQPDAVFIVDLRKEQLAVRGRGRLHHSGQRRRNPLVQPDRARPGRRDPGGTAEDHGRGAHGRRCGRARAGDGA